MSEAAMTRRSDVNQRVHDVIDEVIGEAGQFSTPVAAFKVTAKLRQDHPELLAEWLDAQAVEMIRQAINRREASRRMTARHRGLRTAFTESTRRFEAGDKHAMEGWLHCSYVVNDEYDRKPLAAMNKEDLAFAAGKYHKTADTSLFEELWLLSIAKRLDDDDVVSDCFDDDDLEALRTTLVRENE